MTKVLLSNLVVLTKKSDGAILLLNFGIIE